MPKFPEEGRYAVYVSYSTLENSVDDASYTVWHKGEKTEFRVNQQMGAARGCISARSTLTKAAASTTV